MMDSQAKFQRVLEPGRIGKMEVRNRIVMPPMGMGYADKVTPYTSRKLRGRTAELPRSDFNRQVMRFTRHTLRLFILR